MKTVLVFGGAGYVGSHGCKAFARSGWNVVVFDDLSRGWRDLVRWGDLIEANLLDRSAVAEAVRTVKPDLIVHFAAFAYVGESVSDPGMYYYNNTVGSLNLLEEARAAGNIPIIFSSTCATYGVPVALPITEAHPQNPINPYGWSKLFVEKMLADFHVAHGLASVSLRYFNAAGADPDGEIGEKHQPETHAIPLAIEAALSPDAPFTVLGTDFDTPDGTAVRDYIHVSDLASAHVAAGEFLADNPGCHVFNLGTGVGTSVLQLLAAVERKTGRKPDVQLGPRRIGDPAELVASSRKARDVLGWHARHSSIDNIVASALAWRLAERA
jgi:UDP-arabinose 4-epimerase